MRLTILGERHIRLDTGVDAAGDLQVVGGHFGPLEMLAASLALCTGAVLLAYARTSQLDLAGLAVEVHWEYAERPHRVGRYTLALHVPAAVPPARHPTLVRAAAQCAVHNTLEHPPEISTDVLAMAP